MKKCNLNFPCPYCNNYIQVNLYDLESGHKNKCNSCNKEFKVIVDLKIDKTE